MDGSLKSRVYRLIELACSPLTLLGFLVLVEGALRYGRKTRASSTALLSLYTRYLQHQMGTRRDVVASRLMTVLPNVSPFGLRLSTGAALLAHKLTGYVPTIYRYPYPGEAPINHETAARTTFTDQALAAVAAQTEQLVILGAGNDTRSYRLPADSTLRCFEVDAPVTQKLKRDMLAKAGVDTGSVVYVSANFLHEDWLAKLVDAGFDPAKRSFFVWEGVTMYLNRDAVEGTLRKIAGGAVGTTVAFDYMSPLSLEGNSLFIKYSLAALRTLGEPLIFGLGRTAPARAEVAAFLESCGLALDLHHNFGPESDGHPAIAGFATGVVPAVEPDETTAG